MAPTTQRGPSGRNTDHNLLLQYNQDVLAQRFYTPGAAGNRPHGDACRSRCHTGSPIGNVEKEEVTAFSVKEWTLFIGKLGVTFTGPVNDTIGDVLPAFRKLGFFGTAQVKTILGREYILVRGARRLSGIFPEIGYVASDPKVVDLVVGSKRVMKSAGKSTQITIVLICAVDILEALLVDEELDLLKLGLTIGLDVSKAAIASVVGVLAVSAAAAVGAPVAITLATGIVVGMVVGYTLDYYFPTDKIVAKMLLEQARVSHWTDDKLQYLQDEFVKFATTPSRKLMELQFEMGFGN